MKSVSTLNDTLKTLDAPTSARRLGRFFALHKEMMRVQGAQLPALSGWKLKQQIGFFLFEDASHADALRARRRELPGGRREIEPLDEATRAVVQRALFETGDFGFCALLYLGVKPLLVSALREHLAATTTVSDLPTRRVLKTVIAEQERQIAWMEGALSAMEVTPGERQNARAAMAQLSEGLVAAGGISGEAKRVGEPLAPRDYVPIKDARREPRQIVTLDFSAPDIEGDALQQKVVTQFTAYFREMAAAETLSVLLWDAPPALPWEFFHDTARHFWDEMRHCLAGQQRLEELGFDLYEVPVQTGNYNIRARMPLLERYAYITQVEEAGSFAGKARNEKQFRAAGDTVSADMVALDMADERMHVGLGTKWIPIVQKQLGDARSMEQLVADAHRIRAQVVAQLKAA